MSENRKYRHQLKNKIANEVKSNPKCFWSYINNTRPRQPIKSLINDEGELTNSDYDTAQCLNKFFASVFTRDNSTATEFMSAPISQELKI